LTGGRKFTGARSSFICILTEFSPVPAALVIAGLPYGFYYDPQNISQWTIVIDVNADDRKDVLVNSRLRHPRHK